MYIFFFKLLISVNIKLLRFNHVEACSYNFFISAAEQYSIVWIYSKLVINLPTNRYFKYWQFCCSILHCLNTVKGVCVQWFTQGIYLRVGLLVVWYHFLIFPNYVLKQLNSPTTSLSPIPLYHKSSPRYTFQAILVMVRLSKYWTIQWV